MTSDRIRVLELRSVRGTGGGPEKTILLGAALADPSFEITVCYLRDTRDEVFAVDERARAAGVVYMEIPERHSFDRAIWPALRAVVRDRAIDIVHSHEYKTDFLAWLLARTEGTLALATVHGWTGHSPRERWIYYPLDKWVLGRFPRLIAVSSQIRDELIRAGARADRVTTVLNGIDPQMFRRDRSLSVAIRAAIGLPVDAVVIGSVGRLEPQKRFDLLVDAHCVLKRDFPALHLVIAGDGSERPALTAAITRNRLESSVHLLGHRTDISALHTGFDLFIQSSDYEGTPNAVLEAMALETPTIATAAGGTAELLRHDIDGLIVPISDRAALTSAIRRALTEPDTRAAWTTHARHRVETDLSFEVRTRAVEAIYRELSRLRRSRSERRAGAPADA